MKTFPLLFSISYLIFLSLPIKAQAHSRRVVIEEQNIYINHPQHVRSETVYLTPQPTSVSSVTEFVVAPQQPPSDIAEVITVRPDQDYAWVPGFWSWNNQWVWVKGYWARPPHVGAVWRSGQWSYHPHHHGWVWREGGWN